MRTLCDRRGEWESDNELMALGQTGFKLITDYGVHKNSQPNGTAYINVPYAADTMPTGAIPVDL